MALFEKAVKSTTPLVGVGGWLGLLIAALMVLGPLRSVTLTINNISNAESANNALLTSQYWVDYKAATWVILLIATTVSIGAGYCLYRIHLPSSVRFAIICLWVIGPGMVLADWAAAYLLLFRPLNRPLDSGPFVRTLGVSIVGSFVWTAYLQQSDRVKNTYRSAVVPTAV
jgi:hypothetical protein